MKKLFFVVLGLAIVNSVFSQSKEIEGKLDKILLLVNSINDSLKNKNNSIANKSSSLESLKKDSLDIAKKDDKIIKLTDSITVLGNKISLLEQDKFNLNTDFKTFKKQQTEFLEIEIDSFLKKGLSNDIIFLKNMQKRVENLKPKNEKKLLTLISILDSLTDIKKIFDNPYDVQIITNGKNRLLEIEKKANKELPSVLDGDIKKITKNLAEYCNNTKEVFIIFSKAYDLRKENLGDKNNPFAKELLKAYSYVRNYPYLTNKLNNFYSEPDIWLKLKDTKITCN